MVITHQTYQPLEENQVAPHNTPHFLRERVPESSRSAGAERPSTGSGAGPDPMAESVSESSPSTRPPRSVAADLSFSSRTSRPLFWQYQRTNINTERVGGGC